MTSADPRLDQDCELSRASKHANDLVSRLVRARDLASMMACELDRSGELAHAEARVHSLASDLASAREIANNLGLAEGHIIGGLFGHSRDFASELASARLLASQLGLADARALILSSYLDRARDLTSDFIDAIEAGAHRTAGAIASELARGLADDPGLADIRAFAAALANPAARVSARVPATASAAVGDLVRASGQRKAKRVVLSAASLLTAATRLLPPADRARYAEEYLGELWDLAQSGASRPQQLQYAIRQLLSAPPTGFALRSPRRRSASP